MATRAEARSLTAINALAANPPQYPHSIERLDPLTLYICRVPGSQDIILSTFRPQPKNVTQFEVENSLYYIHLETSADAAPPASPRCSDESARSAMTIPRKPLPGATVADEKAKKHIQPRPQPQPQLQLQPPPGAYRPNPVFAKTGNPAHPLPPTPEPTPDARPLPLLPLLPPLPPVDASASRSCSPAKNQNQNRKRASSSPCFLTIIRRDATSGHQWNVGRVSSLQTNIPTPERAGPELDPNDMSTSRPAPTINIHLETSGYAKYRRLPTRPGVEAHARSGSSAPASASRPEEGFSRTVEMSFSDSWTANIKKAWRRVGRHARSHSHQDGSRDHASCYDEPPGDRPKGYVFLSPWGGQCKFRTGRAGRSLRCQHLLDPAGERLGVGARVVTAAGRARGASVTGAPEPRNVSELRFNLPGGDGLRAGEQASSDEDDVDVVVGDSDSDGDDDNTPDLSGLGREKAGGGKRGSRAKLGKLIVFDEGQKMLDLVVAANVGVWWTVWERRNGVVQVSRDVT